MTRPSCGLNDEELEEGPSRTRPNCDLKNEESCPICGLCGVGESSSTRPSCGLCGAGESSNTRPSCGLCGAGESSNTRPSGALPLFNVKSSSSSVFNRV